MPFASGTYTAPSSPGAFNQAVDGMPATPAAWNALLADLSTALSTAILKDGTQTITANLPMNSHKLTGMIAGTAATDSVMVSQIQTGAVSYATDASVGANTIVLTLSPAITAYTAGLTVSFTAAFTNTSTCTVNVNGVGAVNLTTPDAVALVAGDIKSNATVTVMYNAVLLTWHLVSVTSPMRSNIFTALGAGAGTTLMYRPLATNSFQASNGLFSVVNGLTYQNNAGDATNDLDFAAGGCMDATNAYWLTLSALTKQTDAAWAVGTNAGSLDTGAVGDSDYYIWAIGRADTGVADILTSLSSTAPTMPANYGFKRLIGWFRRTAGAIVGFTTYETAGGGVKLLWDSPPLSVNQANTLTTSRRTDAVAVPQNISTDALLNVTLVDASAGFDVYICCPDQTDVAPGNTTTAPLATFRSVGAGTAAGQIEIKTSATGTIAARASLATVDQYSVSTVGFTMARR